MTVTTTQSRINYAGDNVSVNFPIPFEFFLNTDIAAIATVNATGVGTPLVYGVDFLLSGVGLPAGGTLNKTTPLPVGTTLVIYLNPPILQQSVYQSNAPFPAATLMLDLDRQTQISQRLQDQISRALRAPDSDTLAVNVLPAAPSRANLTLVFDSLGNPTVGTPVSQTIALQQLTFYGTDSGAINAYVVATQGTIPLTLTVGAVVRFTPLTTNNGPSTVNAGGTGVQGIVNVLGSPLTGGEMPSTSPSWLQWTGAMWQLIGSEITPPFARTAAEIAASVTPSNYAYAPGNTLRYGANTTPGTTDMTAAIAAALLQASFGGPAAYLPAGRYGISSDLPFVTGNRDLNGGSQYAVNLHGDGMNQSYIEFLSGGTFTNGVYINGGATAHLAGEIRDVSINAAGHAAQALTLSYTDVASVKRCVVRGSTGRGIYVNNCIMTRIEQCYVIGNGSASYGQVEIDATNVATTGYTTTTCLDQVYVSQGNSGCLAALLIDRAANTVILGGAYESSGIGAMISSKASTYGCAGLSFIGTDFEDCPDHFVEAGYGLSGSAYVTSFEMRNCTGYPSGAVSIPYGVKLDFVSGAIFANNSWTQPGSPTATYWMEGTNPLRISLQTHASLYGLSYPYLMSNGSQVLQASPLVEYDSQETPSKPFVNVLGGITGTTIANSISAQGGYYQRVQLANVGATNVATMTGNACITGTIVYLRGDGQSTLTYGTSANAFQNKSGGNLAVTNNVWYQFMYNGAAWVQLGT